MTIGATEVLFAGMQMLTGKPKTIVEEEQPKLKGRSAHPTRATTNGQFEANTNGKASGIEDCVEDLLYPVN